MRVSTRNILIALAAIATLASVASADPGHGRGKGKWKGYRHARGGGYYEQQYCAPSRVYYRSAPRVVYAPPPVVYAPARPVYVACRPRYVTYRPNRVVVVRPAPYVRIGARIGSVDISAILGHGRGWNDCDYGCNFCDAHFSSYGGYEHHVQSCQYRPANTRIECRQWDDDSYQSYRSDDGGYYDDDDDQGYRGDDREGDGYYDGN